MVYSFVRYMKWMNDFYVTDLQLLHVWLFQFKQKKSLHLSQMLASWTYRKWAAEVKFKLLVGTTSSQQVQSWLFSSLRDLFGKGTSLFLFQMQSNFNFSPPPSAWLYVRKQLLLQLCRRKNCVKGSSKQISSKN